MGRHTTSSIQRLQTGVFTTFGSEWQANNFVSPRVFGSGNFVAFTTPGTTTFIVPAGVTSLRIRVVGGGGGGARGTFVGYAGGDWEGWTAFGFGTTTFTWYGCGGGGGGGGYAHGIFTVTPGTSYQVTVGAGGNGGTAHGDWGTGGTGGTSSFSNLISATGGGGGGQNAGNGGTGTGGSFQATGGTGGAPASYTNRITYLDEGQLRGAGGGGAGSHLGNGGTGGLATALANTANNWQGHGGGIKNSANIIAPGDAFFSYGINASGTQAAEPNPAIFSPRFPFDIFTGAGNASTTSGSGAGAWRATAYGTAPRTAGVGGGSGGRRFSANDPQPPAGSSPTAGIGGGGAGAIRIITEISDNYDYFGNNDYYGNPIYEPSNTTAYYRGRGGSSGGPGLVVVEW